MALGEDILELLRGRGLAAPRRVRLALEELLALVAAENPDLPPPEGAGTGDDGDDDAGLAVRTVACPHCGEDMVVELELDGGDQEAIHDCSVCCRPVRLAWRIEAGRLAGLDAGPG